jgi:hypothetical protein
LHSSFKCSQVTSTLSFLKFLSCIASIYKKKTSLGKIITPMHSLKIFIQTTTFPISMFLERISYAYLTTEKEVLDRKGKLT